MRPKFNLRFSIREIETCAERYPHSDEALLSMAEQVKQRGFLTRDEFLAVCHWKSPRSQPRCRSNSSDFIKDVTQCALSTSSEQLRIEVLTLLAGVSWPTASVILHFFHREQYPLLDVRALWSLRCDAPKQYDFALWKNYVKFCRSLAQKADVSMRTLDRALWQYSKENQR
jgi:hypothetical protein